MSLGIPNIYHQLPLSSHSETQWKLSILHRRGWKRRKLKLLKSTRTLSFTIRSHVFDSSPFENLFQSLISQFPSTNSLDFLAPALGLASGAAVYFSQSQQNSRLIRNMNKQSDKFVGEWILFTSPTPFNRFVMLRCPSITFEGSELLENVNEKLVKEDRHFVRLNGGRIQVREGEVEEAEKLVYQRVCVGTEDGGVISLDWPENLDFEEERGLDTTLLIVPGTAEGSMQREIKDFVCECLRRGCFPVVMNPRGCAGSPLTTPRLFTAADSDDISTAVQFINKARPWTTMMSIGWGYGANMLTKYLAEVGERTCLTAAACIDNPFDLEETTRTTPYHILLDQKLKSGLIDILRSNTELFQGRAKGFDVDKALLATSVRDFEKAISMVSYGFDEIEDFYAKSSTRELVGKVMIPLLFIQNDDGSVPHFSTPRGSIAENPFTSLLLCSYLPSREVTSSRSTVSWYQHLTIEWLTAVELGLLKGRHPLLKDVDVTITPSKGLDVLESRASHKSGRGNKLLNVPNLDAFDVHSINSLKQAFEGGYMTAKYNSRSIQEAKGFGKENMDSLEYSKAVDADLVGEEMTNPVDDERGQVLQTAKVAINMLDLTMPDTLTEEHKKKVLTAVSRGESIIKALQDAVPEDVREKLTTAVSGILHNQESNLKIDRLLSLGRIPEVASKLKSKVQEKAELPSANGENEDTQTSAQIQRVDDLSDSSNKNQPSKDKSPREPESELQASEYLQKSIDSNQLRSTISHASDTPDSDKATYDLGNGGVTADSSGEGTNQVSDSKEKWSETFAKPELPSRSEVAGSAEDKIIEQYKEQDSGKSQSATKFESTNQQNEVKTAESSVDQMKSIPPGQTEDKVSTPVSSGEGTNQVSDSKEKWSETFAKPELPSRSEGAGSAEDKIIEQYKEQDSGKSQSATKFESTNQQNVVKTAESSVDQMKSIPPGQTEDKVSTPVPISESQSMEKEGGDSLRKEDTRMQGAATDESSLSSFNVVQAFDALTGIDDSTQVAVNSVFHVIEDMITQLEVGRDYGNQAEDGANKNEDRGTDIRNEPKERVEVQEQKAGSIPKNQIIYDDYKFEKLEDNRNYKSLPSDTSFDTNSSNQFNKEESARDSSLYFEGNTDISLESHSKSYLYKGGRRRRDLPSRKLSTENLVKHINSIYHPSALSITTNLYVDPLFSEYLQKYLLEKMRTTESQGSDSTLFLDYFPEEDKWKLLELSEDESDIIDDVATHGEVDTGDQTHLSSNYEDIENIIEPSYVILDSDAQEEQVQKFEKENNFSGEIGDETFKKLLLFVKSIMLDTLKFEVDRRVSATDIEEMQPELAKDLVLVANAVCLSVRHEEHTFFNKTEGHISDKFGILGGQYIIKAISSAVQETSYLRRVLPVGVIVGSSLAALRKYFDVSAVSQGEVLNLEHTQLTMRDANKMVSEMLKQKDDLDSVMRKHSRKIETNSSNGNTLMVGAFTAALGASALLIQQQNSGTSKTLSKTSEGKGGDFKGPKNEEEIPGNMQNNIVTSLAEKAMTVAGPVVPTKEGGEVDHERLVAMLAELGQKGGALKLVGNIALLWGGIRGALSLIEKLISFSRLAERPLFQRISGFVFMVIVLWSPVVVPLLPSLVRSWANHNSPRITELVCLIGLYVSVMVMVTLWGKRIRGYDNPLKQYGLDMTSLSKVQNFAMALFGGVVLVLLIHCVNFFCGFVQLSGPSYLPASPSNVVAWLKVSGRTLLLVFQGLATATGVAVVEELLFRSWLPDEIATDLGYYCGIVLSGLVFSLSQRSLWAIPGLWLLSVGLAGARQRSQGSLAVPIGVRAGILVSSFVLQRSCFLTYHPSKPIWLYGSHPLEPFSGIIGLAFSLLLAVVLYPRQHLIRKKSKKILKG